MQCNAIQCNTIQKQIVTSEFKHIHSFPEIRKAMPDMVFEAVGEPTFNSSLKCLQTGIYVLYAYVCMYDMYLIFSLKIN